MDSAYSRTLLWNRETRKCLRDSTGIVILNMVDAFPFFSKKLFEPDDHLFFIPVHIVQNDI